MVLNTEWSQVEVIELVNDGSGLGFGIVGGKSTGVIIKSILPGGIADRDNRLQSGDHILQIGDVNLRGLGSDQVASVLRQTGPEVRMVVARPTEPSTIDVQAAFDSNAPIVPTKVLTNPEQLDHHIQNGYMQVCRFSFSESSCIDDHLDDEAVNVLKENLVNDRNLSETNNNSDNNYCSSPGAAAPPLPPPPPPPPSINIEQVVLPETERYSVELNKNESGLGITIAGYVCESQDLSGVFVKSIVEGSEAYRCGKIKVNDRIVQVDGQSLQGFTNHQAVEKLKQSGNVVRLTLERSREALSNSRHQRDKQSPLSSPLATTTSSLSWIPIETETVIEPEEGGESVASSINSSDIYENNPESVQVFVDENFEGNLSDDDDSRSTTVRDKWNELVDDSDSRIVVARINKLQGLGISLEGTVQVEGGVELGAKHFIRSILPDGPVGQNGKLKSGDQLLEVNGQKLVGLKHVEVVKILKNLPHTVRLVCARKREENRVINTSQDLEAFEARNILGGSLKTLLPQQQQQPEQQKLLKALSDTSINTTSSTATVSEKSTTVADFQKTKSRSLESTDLAMWSDSVEFVQLQKNDRGLGFSILDYQDPLDPRSTVIVIRSLVPNGPAESDGRLKPGDRLISVNDRIIKNVTLDQAVQALKSTIPGIVKIGVSRPLLQN